VPDGAYQDGTFWGIRFPTFSPPFDQSTIDMAEKDLESRWHTMLNTCLKRLDLATVLLSFEAEVNRELIEHTMCFKAAIEFSCQTPALFLMKIPYLI
jgi:hypothetical protein